MSYKPGQVFSLPHSTVFSLPHGLSQGPPTPPVFVANHIITEDANVAPAGPNFIIGTEVGDQLITEQ
jgi:hypothetical protein